MQECNLCKITNLILPSSWHNHFYCFFQHGNTALHESAWKGYSRTVDLLCRNKSNYYLRNRGGFSPLHLCCQNGHNESCRVLLRAGCKPNIKNNVSIIIDNFYFKLVLTCFTVNWSQYKHIKRYCLNFLKIYFYTELDGW